MLARAVTHALVGLEPRRVQLEADVHETGLPSFAIIGLPNRAWYLHNGRLTLSRGRRFLLWGA